MTNRKLAPKTQAGYIRAVRRFAEFLRHSPDRTSVKDALAPFGVPHTIIAGAIDLVSFVMIMEYYFRIKKDPRMGPLVVVGQSRALIVQLYHGNPLGFTH
jgi:hypothetical protein